MKTQLNIPVEIIPEAAWLLHQNKITAQLMGTGNKEGHILIEVQYESQHPHQSAVIDNIDTIIKDFNHYRFGKNGFFPDEENNEIS